jgi:hypothetical protein
MRSDGQRPGEGEARQGRDDDVEAVSALGIAARAGGIGEHGNDPVVAVERVGPAVEQQQRRGARTAAFDVDEVEVGVTHARRVLRQRIQRRLAAPPVVTVQPVGDETTQVRGVGAGLPAHLAHLAPRTSRGHAGRPARTLQPGAQIVEHGVLDLDLEAFNGAVARHATKPAAATSRRKALASPAR